MPFKPSVNWKEELPRIKELGLEGKRMVEIGAIYGVSRQRVKQVINKYIPEWGHTYGPFIVKQQQVQEHFKKWGKKENTDLYHIQRHKFNRKKANAIKTGHKWDLSFSDLDWPTHCPILGIEIDYYAEKAKDASVSFDQFIPSLGYINGNVILMSWKANRIKSNGSAEDHRKIADFIDSTRLEMQENSLL